MAKAASVTSISPSDSEKRSKALQNARSKAVSILCETHRIEFNDLIKAEAKKLGVEWTPKPTEEEKAKAELDEILARFPHLAPVDSAADAE